MDTSKNSIEHLDYILSKLQNKEPFAIIRPADGEYLVMTNKYFTNIDNWTFNGGKLRNDLLSIKDLKKYLNNFYIGIPCPECQGNEMTEWYKKTLEIKDNELTYANIFCNKNWINFTNYLKTTNLPINYIGPGTIINNGLNIKNIFTIDKYLVNNWDSQKEIFISNIIDWVNNITDNKDLNTFLFSAGPISKYIIPILYKKYPKNQFIDVGSSIDIFMTGSTNRGYLTSNYHNKIICSFNNGHLIV